MSWPSSAHVIAVDAPRIATSPPVPGTGLWPDVPAPHSKGLEP
ncbi:MAG TPA: hypothetical protein VNP95_06200 [Thermomicrobiales bacterium]|nr:hypothetical protein [Thermomicrobiales bacterium]